jgi:ketosteroid isomerase-like protein
MIAHHTRRPSQGPGIDRRELLRKGMAGTALGAAALALPGLARADASAGSAESVQVGEIYQLQAAFHRAKTTQDLDLMMSLWAVDAVLVNQGDSNSPYAGTDAIRAFFAGSGSFTHRRLSLVPSFKTRSAYRATRRGSTSSATTSATTTSQAGSSPQTYSWPGPYGMSAAPGCSGI